MDQPTISESQNLPLSDLRLMPGNPRIMDGTAKDMLKASLERYGCVEPLVVTPEGVVLGGNQRLECAEEMGWTTIPCVVVDGLSDAAQKALNLALNQLSGTWDYALLKVYVEDVLPLVDEETLVTGFDDAELEAITGEELARPVLDDVTLPGDEGGKPQKDAYWFYVEYYGEQERYDAIVEALGDNLIPNSRRVDANWFEEMAAKHGGICAHPDGEDDDA